MDDKVQSCRRGRVVMLEIREVGQCEVFFFKDTATTEIYTE